MRSTLVKTTVTPEGPIGKNAEALRLMFADSTKFRELAKANSQEEALAHIWFGDIHPDAEDLGEDEGIDVEWFKATRPLIELDIHNVLRRRNGEPGGSSLSLTFEAKLEVNRTSNYSGNGFDEAYWFFNQVDVIEKEIWALRGRHPYADLDTMTLQNTRVRADRSEIEEIGDYLWCSWVISIGNR